MTIKIFGKEENYDTFLWMDKSGNELMGRKIIRHVGTHSSVLLRAVLMLTPVVPRSRPKGGERRSQEAYLQGEDVIDGHVRL